MNLKMFSCYYLSEIIMVIVLLFYCYKTFSMKPKLSIIRVISLLLLTTLLILNNYYSAVFLKIFISIILDLLMIKICYKINIKEGLYSVIIFSVLSIIVELLLTVVLFISISDINKLNNQYVIKMVFSMVHSVILYLLLSRKRFVDFLLKLKSLFRFNNILIIFVIMIDTILIYRAYILDNLYVFILTIACCLFIVITIRVITNDKYNIDILLNKNKHLKQSYKAYSETIEKCSEFKHNIKNELYALNTSLPKKTQKSINTIINKYNIEYEWITKIDEIPEGLQGMFYLKQEEAKSKRINLIINITKKVNISSSDYFDLCEIIGILLDNAIDATINCNKKNIDVSIIESKNTIEIYIKNPFSNSIDINKLWKKDYSTKKIKSGIGLNYIKNMKKANTTIGFKIINDIFITKVIYTKANL